MMCSVVLVLCRVALVLYSCFVVLSRVVTRVVVSKARSHFRIAIELLTDEKIKFYVI